MGIHHALLLDAAVDPHAKLATFTLKTVSDLYAMRLLAAPAPAPPVVIRERNVPSPLLISFVVKKSDTVLALFHRILYLS